VRSGTPDKPAYCGSGRPESPRKRVISAVLVLTLVLVGGSDLVCLV